MEPLYDKIQRELAATETFLRTSASKSADVFWMEGSSSSSSVPAAGAGMEDDDEETQAFGRYADPVERERLIARLLEEHNLKTASQHPESNDSTSTDAPDDGGGDDRNTLFFASDLSRSRVSSSREASGGVRSSRATDFEEFSAPYSSSGAGDDSDAFDRLSGGPGVSFVGGRGNNSNNSTIKSRGATLTATTTMSMSTAARRPSSAPPLRRPDNGDDDLALASTFDRNRYPTHSSAPSTSAVARRSADDDAALTSKAASVSWSIPISEGGASKPVPKRFLKSKEELQEDAEASFKKAHAFKPTLTSKQATHTHGAGDPAVRIEEMNRRHQRAQAELQKRKKDQLQKELSSCTFKPQITKLAHDNPRNRSASPSFDAVQFLEGGSGYGPQGRSGDSLGPISSTYLAHRPPSSLPTVSADSVPPPPGDDPDNDRMSRAAVETSRRLHDEAEMRAAQQRWLEKQVNDLRHAQYTFQPAINPATSAYFEALGTEYRPIHERVADLQRDKKERMKELKKECDTEAQAGLTFTPTIDPHSRRIAERRLLSDPAVGSSASSTSTGHARRSSSVNRSRDTDVTVSVGGHGPSGAGDLSPDSLTDVSSRLYQDARRAELRKKALQREVELERAAQMEQPKPSKGTERLAQRSATVAAPFHDRQSMHAARVQTKQQDMSRAQEEEGASWFKPEIGKSADIVASKRPALAQETPEERADRLSNGDALAIQERRKAKEEEVYGGLTFAPAIDPVSKALGRSPNLKELVENKRGQRARELARQAVKRVEDEELTFKPALTKYPARYDRDEYVQLRGGGERSADAACGGGGGVRGSLDSATTGGDADADAYAAETTPVSWADCGLAGAHAASSSSSSSSSAKATSRAPRNVWAALHSDERDSEDESLEPISYQYKATHGPPPGKKGVAAAPARVPGYQRKCTVHMQHPERMARDIRQQLLEKEERRRAELVAREIEEMRQCTFKPSIPAYQPPSPQPSITASIYYETTGQPPSDGPDTPPVVIRGLSRHLELQHLSAKQREDAERRERDAFTVKNVDKFRRAADGSTIVQPFVLSDIPTRPSRAVAELEAAQQSQLTFRPNLPATSRDRINASTAAAAAGQRTGSAPRRRG